MSIWSVGTDVPADSNSYLITGDSNILVDTGLGLFPSRLLERVRSGLNGKNLDKIILTHCHIDHVGGAKALASEYGCKVYAHRTDAGRIRSGNSDYVLDAVFGIPFEPPEVEDLEAGDVIDTGNHRFEVIHTPGHTEGSICLYDSVTGSLVSGDTLLAPGVGRTDLKGGSFPRMIDSLKLLSNYRITGLYPGHGGFTESRGRDYLSESLTMAGVFVEDY